MPRGPRAASGTHLPLLPHAEVEVEEHQSVGSLAAGLHEAPARGRRAEAQECILHGKRVAHSSTGPQERVGGPGPRTSASQACLPYAAWVCFRPEVRPGLRGRSAQAEWRALEVAT